MAQFFPGSVWPEFPVTVVQFGLLRELIGWLPVLWRVTDNENGVYLMNRFNQVQAELLFKWVPGSQGSTAGHLWLCVVTWDHAHTSTGVKTLLTLPADIRMDTQRNLGITEAGGRPTISCPLGLMAALALCAPLLATLCKDNEGNWVWLVGWGSPVMLQCHPQLTAAKSVGHSKTGGHLWRKIGWIL